MLRVSVGVGSVTWGCLSTHETSRKIGSGKMHRSQSCQIEAMPN